MKLQIKIDGRTYEAEVEVLEEAESQPSYEPYSFVPATQEMPSAGAYTPGHAVEVHALNEKEYRSPVTGLVIKVNVEPGQEIQPSDVIVVLEAMKMETTVTAHHAGRVKSVNVAPGNPVKLHQVLVELE